jgi:hypothetical protein
VSRAAPQVPAVMDQSAVLDQTAVSIGRAVFDHTAVSQSPVVPETWAARDQSAVSVVVVVVETEAVAPAVVVLSPVVEPVDAVVLDAAVACGVVRPAASAQASAAAAILRTFLVFDFETDIVSVLPALTRRHPGRLRADSLRSKGAATGSQRASVVRSRAGSRVWTAGRP